MEQRGKLLLAAFAIAIVVLVGRLCYIQITCGPALSTAAGSQQIVPVIYPYSRGIIYDRNMNKLTNTSEEYYYLVSKENCTSEFEELIGHIGGKKAGKKGESYEVYHVDQFQTTINRLLCENFDAYGFCISGRYADEQVAVHLIGYVNTTDGVGASGLEKMYEAQLSCASPAANLAGDGAGSVLAGVGLIAANGETELPAGLLTTIDGDLQLAVETLLAEQEISGSVVIADSATGQILTMASSLAYNPNDLEAYLNNESSELVNKAVQCQYPIGPLVDIIQTVASLGNVSLMEAAKALGLGQCVWENFPDEAAGSLPDFEDVTGDEATRKKKHLGELAAMRKSTEVTPIQVCQMLVTLNNGGERIPLSVVMHAAKEEAEACLAFEAEKRDMLQRMLRDELVNGDGWAAGLSQNYAVVVNVEDRPKKAVGIYGDIETLLTK